MTEPCKPQVGIDFHQAIYDPEVGIHFHCWHDAGHNFEYVTHDHGLSRVKEKLTVQRCCQCPAKREGYTDFEGGYVEPQYMPFEGEEK